jgi:hypothetical protein
MRQTEKEEVLATTPEAGSETLAEQCFFYAATRQTPWWIVSLLMHALLITLAGLLSIQPEWPELPMPLVITEVYDRKVLPPEVERKPGAAMDDLKRPSPTSTPTDPGPTEARPINYPPEVLAVAVFGNHYETNNPGMEDHGEPLGEPDSHIVWAPEGLRGDIGGGGNEGICLTDDVVGIGGVSSAGKDGGYGGGERGGFGDGFGPGKATFGGGRGGRKFMLVRRHNNPDPKTMGPRFRPDQPVVTVNAALDWLARHQEYDGHWDAKKHGAAAKTDTAVTGLALLAFLGSGHTERVGEYRGVVERAVAWLKSKQAADGCVWDTTDDSAHHRKIGYPNAIATLALVEAAGMGNRKDTVEAAQKAVDYCTLVHQAGSDAEKGGWRYAPKEEGDLSVTGWYLLALKSAKVARLSVPAKSFEGALRFLDALEIRDGARSGYGVASRYKYTATAEHANTAHRLTAIGNLCRQFMGWKKDELQASVEWFVTKGGVPAWGANGEKVDLYYWYYGTMCVFQQQDEALWRRWNTGMLKSLTDNQCAAGGNKGSWNPVGDYASEWGRVGQTALSALCLEVYWRYDLVRNS